MDKQQALQLIERKRAQFQKLLFIATGIDLSVAIYIHSSFQVTQPLIEAARQLNWHVDKDEDTITAKADPDSLGGTTRVFSPVDPAKAAQFADFPFNPFNTLVTEDQREKARCALERLARYVPLLTKE